MGLTAQIAVQESNSTREMTKDTTSTIRDAGVVHMAAFGAVGVAEDRLVGQDTKIMCIKRMQQMIW